MKDDVQARIVMLPSGEMALKDPTAEGVIAAAESYNRRVNRQNCDMILRAQADRLAHFRQRIYDRGSTPAEVAIAVIMVDDPMGSELAELTCPNPDTPWQAYRDRGETPIARGLLDVEGLGCYLKAQGYSQEAAQLESYTGRGQVTGVVVAFNTVVVYDVDVILKEEGLL
ncbi:MAG: hypothetical protein KDB07_00360 [Planctomycetes bacterium]|nr:hypothetical protein [Planctomycetota bacterium]